MSFCWSIVWTAMPHLSGWDSVTSKLKTCWYQTCASLPTLNVLLLLVITAFFAWTIRHLIKHGLSSIFKSTKWWQMTCSPIYQFEHLVNLLPLCTIYHLFSVTRFYLLSLKNQKTRIMEDYEYKTRGKKKPYITMHRCVNTAKSSFFFSILCWSH